MPEKPRSGVSTSETTGTWHLPGAPFPGPPGLGKDVQTAVAPHGPRGPAPLPQHAAPVRRGDRDHVGAEGRPAAGGGGCGSSAPAPSGGEPPGPRPPRLRVCVRKSHSSQVPYPHTSPRRLADRSKKAEKKDKLFSIVVWQVAVLALPLNTPCSALGGGQGYGLTSLLGNHFLF